MKTIDLRREVEAAIQQSWGDFETAHPRLASVLDQELVIEGAMQSLSENADYQHAMADAAAAGVLVESAGSLVGEFVKDWLGRLV
jgi:hypothetical protein